MACNTLEGILKSCDSNAGGVVKFYVNNADQIDTNTMVIVDGEVTALDLIVSGDTFVEFEFNPNTSNFTENMIIDLTQGSTFYEQVVTLVLNRREARKRQSLLLIAEGQPELTVIVKDANGLFWLFGAEDDKMYLTGNEGGTGTAKGDHNGYTLTFTSESSVQAYVIDGAVVDSLI